mmetsp:Transcript_82305/g.266464  ORF Transcript_82305/g.266464 Transcript_82305/m.266464 type:complete len:914 (+) Transcript_82305:60-2801(+)
MDRGSAAPALESAAPGCACLALLCIPPALSLAASLWVGLSARAHRRDGWGGAADDARPQAAERESLLPGKEVEDRTDQSVARRVDSGHSIRFSNGPTLRVDWERLLGPEQDHLRGQVTVQERLWGVIVTMGIAGMRTQVLLDGDITWYVLNFFCFYDAVMASIMYSTRFNDTDIFHHFLWALFTLGMAGQAAYLNQDMHGFALCTGFLYLLLGVALLRVGLWLPRARFLALHDAAYCLFGAAILGSLHRDEFHDAAWRRTLLAGHALLRPLGFLSFWFFTRTPALKAKRDVPVNIWYMISRFEGLYMMIIVCSVLFPLGLAGSSFLSSGTAALQVLLGNVYALLLKLSLMDVTHRDQEAYLHLHAIRYGSRARALIFLLIFPYGVLGIALTGVGLVSCPSGASEELSRVLLSGGACLTWAMVTLADACHGDPKPYVHRVKILVQLAAAAAFLGPWFLELSSMLSVCWLVVEMALLLLVQLLFERLRLDGPPPGWQWRRPQLLMPRPSADATAAVTAAAAAAAMAAPSQKVSSQEHFFTVLLAVAVLKLNLNLDSDRDVWQYFFSFVTVFFVIWSTIRYAARFKNEDLSHKLVWSVFEVALLLMLEGISATAATSDPRAEGLLSLATTSMFLVLALCFTGRAAWSIHEARPFCSVFMSQHLLCASLSLLAFFFEEMRRPVHCAIAVFLFSADSLSALLFVFRREWYISMNHEYLVARVDGLLMEVLGVAVIVPNSVFPGLFPHSGLVAAGDALAVKLAVSIKAAIFCVEPIEKRRHAINRGVRRSAAYIMIVFFTVFALSMLGAGIPLIIISAGELGYEGRSCFAQALTCGAASLLWASLALTKLLHRYSRNEDIHNTKAFVQALGSAASLLPVFVSTMSDFGSLCWITAIGQVVEWTQYWLICGCFGDLCSSV